MKTEEKVVKKRLFEKKSCVLLVALIISVCMLIVGSNNSFLYKFNDCVDLNWFITMGNGLLAGKLPYRDLFEQKGPILYFIFAFVCLFNNPYIVVWVFEVIALTFFLYYSYQIAKRFVKTNMAYLTMFIIAAVVVSSGFFYQNGGAVEEFFMPMLAYMFLCMFEFMEDKKPFTIRRSFVIGLIVAIMFWIKFTLLIIPAIMLLIWFFVNLHRKNIKNTLTSILFMLLGVVIVTIPILLFFYLNHCLKDLFDVYIISNIFGYTVSTNSAEKVQQFMQFSIFNTFMSIFQCALSFIIMAIGLIGYTRTHKKASIWLWLLFIFSLAVQLCIKMSIYYFLTFEIFAIVGVATLLQLIERCKFNKLSTVFLNLFIISISLFVGVFVSNHTKQLFREKRDYPQMYFANVIKSYGIANPSLFCYCMIDYGFYNAAGIVPDEYYFARNNFAYEGRPEMFESFDVAVSEAHAEFVVAFKQDFEAKPELFANYELIVEKTYDRHKTNYRFETVSFVLLKRI